MMGGLSSQEEYGIIPRALDDIFKELALDKKYSYVVSIGYLQIYMEMVTNYRKLLNFHKSCKT